MPPDKRQEPKARTKSTDNVRVVEMRKERSRNAARNRRGKENAQFDELAKLLPLPLAITSQLDKASIVRLTISYLNMREFSGVVPQRQITDGSIASEHSLSPMSESGADGHSGLPTLSSLASLSTEIVPLKDDSSSIPVYLNETGTQLLQALDGFLLVLSEEGKILYVSETVSVNLGLSQVELTGSNVFNYVHVEDHTDLLEQLSTVNIEAENQTLFPDPQELFACQKRQENNPSFNQGDAIQAPKLLPHQPRSFFIRMKCTLVRRGGSYSKSSGFKVVHCVGRIKSYASDPKEAPRRAFVILAQPVPTMNINELPLECNMFVSRVNMDLKIVYCEGRINRFMDYLAKDIVGISAYDFYHAGDVALIQNHHAKFLAKGQVWTKYYRWMNMNGGWVWMQTKASLIPHPSNPGLKQMLCLNYILSEVEHRSVVLGMAQLKDKPELTLSANTLTEVPCEGDNTGELKDAQIDDQVMSFPKWQATSDKLLPETTVLDQMALQRTGYTSQFNETFNQWSDQHRWAEQQPGEGAQGSPDLESDKDLQDIVDIIDADLTAFDRTLFDYVVSGSQSQSLAPTQQSQLGPIGAYIEEIDSSSTFPINRDNVVVTKMEDSAMQGDYGSVSCAQSGRTTDEFAQGSNGVRAEGTLKRPANSYTYRDSTTPSKIPKLSHIEGMVPSSSASAMYSKPHNRPSTIASVTTMQNINPYQEHSSTSTTTQSTGSHFARESTQNNMASAMATANSYQTKTKNPTTRKPKNLLEQLAMMPSKESDLFNDDLMFDIVEELLEESNADDNDLGYGRVFDNSGPGDLGILIPSQKIKQEIVTPTSTEPQTPFSACFQNMPNLLNEPQFKPTSTGMYQKNVAFSNAEKLPSETGNLRADNARSRTHLLESQQNALHKESPLSAFPDQSSTAVRPPVSLQQQQQKQQQQWPGRQQQTQRLQHSWKQQQLQQQQQLQTTQGAKQQGSHPQTALYSQQQAHVQNQQQNLRQQAEQQLWLQQQQQDKLLQQQQQLLQQQQQQPQQQTPYSQEQRILRDLNELIRKNNNMQPTQSFPSQQSLTISSAPLPELGNGLDDELNNLPLDQQTANSASLSRQGFNNGNVGTGDQLSHNLNFTGMM